MKTQHVARSYRNALETAKGMHRFVLEVVLVRGDRRKEVVGCTWNSYYERLGEKQGR